MICTFQENKEVPSILIQGPNHQDKFLLPIFKVLQDKNVTLTQNLGALLKTESNSFPCEITKFSFQYDSASHVIVYEIKSEQYENYTAITKCLQDNLIITDSCIPVFEQPSRIKGCISKYGNSKSNG